MDFADLFHDDRPEEAPDRHEGQSRNRAHMSLDMASDTPARGRYSSPIRDRHTPQKGDVQVVSSR